MEMDLTSSVSPKQALNLQAISSNTTVIGNIIDNKGFGSVDIVLSAGVLTDGTYTLKIEHGDDASLSDASDVPAELIIGTLPALDTDNSIGHVGIVSKKRYFRVSIISTSVSTGATVSVIATLGHAKKQPTV